MTGFHILSILWGGLLVAAANPWIRTVIQRFLRFIDFQRSQPGDFWSGWLTFLLILYRNTEHSMQRIPRTADHWKHILYRLIDPKLIRSLTGSSADSHIDENSHMVYFQYPIPTISVISAIECMKKPWSRIRRKVPKTAKNVPHMVPFWNTAQTVVRPGSPAGNIHRRK